MADPPPEPPRPDDATFAALSAEAAGGSPAGDSPTRVDLDDQPGWLLAWEDGSPLPTAGSLPRYELRSELARGGLGRVHFAWDRRLARAVAIKEPLTAAARARFYREALLTARLQHPGIVPIYDAGNDEHGAPFYAMRLLGEGRSFSDAIAAAPTLAERLTLLPHVIAAADAVAYAHSQNIIHRDLKPDNILLGPFGETVVIDWGLAKDLAAAEPAALAPEPALADGAPGGGATPSPGAGTPSPGYATPLTVAGTTVGTPAYMSPEQIFHGEVDARTDVYSLGAVLIELLAGKKAAPSARLASGSAASLRRQLPGVPADLAAVLHQAMAADPASRYPTARELAADLRRFTAGQLVAAHFYSPFHLARRWLARHRWPVGIAAVSLTLLVLSGVAAVRRVVLERNRAEAARASAEERNDALTLVQARTSLERDPTAALAWLATYRDQGAHQDVRRSLVADAAARGVARHILPFSDRVRALAFAREGRLLVAADYAKLLRLFDTREGRLLGEWQRPGGSSLLVVLETPPGAGAADPRAGLRVLTGGADGRLLLVDLESGSTWVFTGHSGVLTGLVVLRDRRTSLSTARDGSVYRCDLETGEGRLLGRHDGSATALALSPDEKLAVSAGRDGRLLLHDLERGGPPREIATGVPITALAISPLSTAARPLLLTAGDDFRVRLWDPAGGGSRVLTAHGGIVAGVAFSPDGRLAASASRDREVRVIALDPRAAALTRTYTGHTDDLETLRFSPDGARLASAGLDGTIRLIDLAAGRQQVLGGSRLMIETLSFSPDGSWLAAGTQDRDVRVWSTRQEPEDVLEGHSNDVDALLFLPGAGGGPPAGLVSAGHDRTIRVWPYHAGEAGGRGRFGPGSQVLAGHRETVDQLALLPDGRLVSGSGDQTVRIWDLAHGTSRVLEGHGHAVSALLVADGGRTLLSASLDGTVRVWDLAASGGEAPLRILKGEQGGAVLAMALAPDGNLLATAGADHLVRLWDWRQGRQLAALAGHADQVGVLAFAPDGRGLASGAFDGGLRFWHGEGLAESLELRGHSERVRSLLFSPDGRTLASSSIDKSIRLWNVATGEARILAGHEASVRHLAFSPDGRLLSSSSTDRTARLWDVASGELRALRRYDGIVTGSAFSADGRFLAIGGWDQLVHVYPAYTEELLPAGAGSLRLMIEGLTTVSTDQNGGLASRAGASP